MCASITEKTTSRLRAKGAVDFITLKALCSAAQRWPVLASVRVHWLTDAQYNRGGPAPDNVSDEPGHRRGPEKPPLNDA